MHSWSLRFGMLCLMVVSLVGCDSNPDGPSAPSVSANPGGGTAPATKAPTTKARGKGNSNAPVLPD